MRGSSVAPSMAEHDAEYDHSTLSRAEEIKADAGRMKGVRKHHAKTTQALRRMKPIVAAGRKSGR